MMKTLVTVAALCIGASCTIAQDLAQNHISIAEQFLGLHERTDRSKLRAVVGVDPVRTEWCAAFVNAVLDLSDTPTLYTLSDPYPLLARSFLGWGTPVDPGEIAKGDVVIFPRGSEGWKGHVGFYVETQIVDDREYWMILGGNQDNTVSYALYPARDSLGVRRWQQP